MSAAFEQALADLGSTPADPGQEPDLVPQLVDPVPDGELDPGLLDRGLPAGTLELCTGLALATGALTGTAVSGIGVAIQLWLPEVMAAAYRSPAAMRPRPPIEAPGGGYVHADLGSPPDAASFEALLATLGPVPDARQLAAAAQEWRLPVCDYRTDGTPPSPRWILERGTALAPTGGPVEGGRVLDLTNMWAGPLATWILQSLGATVTKIEPAFRPDGFRAVGGGGIHPGGRQCDPGHDSAMWNSLNRGKRVVDLDLRDGADRDAFLVLAAGSDVVIDSFSRRVMPNFGLALPDGPLYVSMPAFPPGPEGDWVAYGTGVHALSGLGHVGAGRMAAPAVSYPDPVAGFTAALAVAAALTGRRRGVAVGRVECPLAAAVGPLRSTGPGHPLLLADSSGTGTRLLEMGRERGLFETLPVCGLGLPHPRPVFAPKQNVF